MPNALLRSALELTGDDDVELMAHCGATSAQLDAVVVIKSV
jgi:hypothetical protein